MIKTYIKFEGNYGFGSGYVKLHFKEGLKEILRSSLEPFDSCL